jgi:stage II sporulation protein D
MRRISLCILLWASLLMIPAGCSRTVIPSTAADAPIVRVRLLESQDKVLVTASSPPLIQTTTKAAAPMPFPNAPVEVVLATDGWRIGDVPVGTGELIVSPSPEGSVEINGQSYRGTYRLVPVGANKFDLINYVDIDSYLKSVVSRELLSGWHEEAYKAQAIVARTYALYEAKTNSTGKYWDLYDDTRSQVYGGIKSESNKSIRAVDATAGVVLAYGPEGQEKIFKAYFSSCCGGISQSAYDAFGDPYIEPLSDQNVGPMCNISPHFNWGPIDMTKAELTRRIKAWGASKGRAEKDMGPLDRIDIQYVNRFNRPIRFLLTDTSGKRYSLGSEETRWACNFDAPKDGPKLKSSFFRPVSNGDKISFVDGHGYGHGAGMCQWCTEARAEAGWRHEDIVLTSFPKAKLFRAY